ncbi:MAG: tetratricopeptide repeat protein [Methylococcales bacterium]|nr:tetratricopeptide repeat protein [Methylococcales bacterium]
MAARTCYITFYSYKGGVGRTLALANCARALVASGKKIVLMDFDLEAPGLHHFQPFQPNSRIKRPQGFAEYLEASLNQGPPTTLDAYIHPCLGKEGDKGRAWLMPAGRHNEPGYLGFLNGTTWNDFYTQREGYKILEHLRGHIIHDYQPDYVFIDARTGLSEIGGIATHQLADLVVLVFNLNGQNLDGAKRVFDSIKKAPLPPKVILLASPVPVMPTDKHTPFAKKMQAIKKDFKGAENADKPLVIPYHPLLAIDDRLLVDDGDLFSSDAPYRRVVDLIKQIAVDVDIYLRQMIAPMQRGDWQKVRDIALQGLQVHPSHIQLLWHLASAYDVTDEPEKELATYDELFRHHADTKVLDEQVLVAKALMNKGATLGQLQRPEEALAAYGRLIERFADAKALDLQELVAKTLCNKSVTLGQLQHPEEALAAYGQLLERFADAEELVLQEPIARALVNKGVTLGQLQRPEEELAVYEQLLRRFADAEALVLQVQVANALLNKGVTLVQLQRPEEALAAYGRLLERFVDTEELVLQEFVAKSLFIKGVVLEQLQRPEEALASYGQLLERFAAAEALVLQELVARAWGGKGLYFLWEAKKSATSEQRHSLLQTALNCFEQALVHVAATVHAMALGNQAYTQFLLGDSVASATALKDALILGGQKLYEAELAVSQFAPLPEDQAFRTLLDTLWEETKQVA